MMIFRLGMVAMVVMGLCGCSIDDDDDPNLTISSVAVVPAMPMAGEPTDVVIRIENRADVDADATDVIVRVDRDDVRLRIPRLDAWETTTIRVTVVLPSGTTVMQVMVDPDDIIDEDDETDNDTLWYLRVDAPWFALPAS
jgi:subtilase family serine protease